ncbi:hypothetical protein DERF_005742 [Dermatophagoides farinae]|uniref:Uncharacterized protein n=1 Tax=Dermatophagoides farinae TaxID=6954 RepID=A0A922L7G0_DERFA|nr:hypothetical protein DERF_005742 [Dermatophagoides farinae]
MKQKPKIIELSARQVKLDCFHVMIMVNSKGDRNCRGAKRIFVNDALQWNVEFLKLTFDFLE